MQGNESPSNIIQDRELGVLSVSLELAHQAEIPGVPAGLDYLSCFVMLRMGRIQ